MQNNNNVTLPTAATLKNLPLPLSDYSRLLGARSVYATNIVDETLVATYGDKRYDFGEVWLNTLGDNTQEVQTYTWRDARDGGNRLHSRNVLSQHVAVVPCFVAREDGVDVRLIDGENLLTVNGKVAYYPQSQVTAAERQDLNHAYYLLNNQHENTMKLVGGYTRPVRYDYERQKYHIQKDLCFNFQGKNYVRVMLPDGACEWVNCEPIKAYKTTDGQVLPKQTLLAGSFDQPETYFEANYLVGPNQELTVQDYHLGKFLNNELLQDLRNSTRLNEVLLTQPKARFAGLKGATADRERNR